MANMADQNLPEPHPREVLKYLLGRIYRTRNRQIQLCRSLEELLDWMSAPIGTSRYSPTPQAAGAGDGAAATAIIQMAEIEDRHRTEQAEIARAAQGVMDLVGLLPMDSMERAACEMRHILLLSWPEIAAQIPMSRRHVARIYDGVLDILLECREARRAIAEAAGDYTRWDLARRASQRRWTKVGR